MEHELKRQKLIIAANSSIQLERVKQDSHREIANLEALERRELEFQQLQEKEKERAMNAQKKLRELAFQELRERISLERELAKQQQQNLLLRKQSEIDKLQSEADKRLFEQQLAEKRKRKGDPPVLTITHLSQLLLNHLVRIHRRLVRIGLGYFINSLLLLHSLLCRRFYLLKCWIL